MSEGSGGSANDSVDSFLRQLARAPEATPPQEPERLGRFRITGRLGEGGMGVVYCAEDEALHRKVAIKVVAASRQGEDEHRKRLVREARAAAAVMHPNIAAVYEIGESAGRVFLAMEYVEGPTLRSLVAAGPMAPARALSIARQIADGLAKAHRASVVHRDLKPDNVIVGVDGHAKVLDFGLARLRASRSGEASGVAASPFTETLTAEGQRVGTPAYAAPEQAKGEEVGPPADVFAFGVTFYEMLTGQRPFAGGSLAELTRAIERDAPRAPSRVNPAVPDAFDRVVAKCLAKEPRDRFANGDELVRALAELAPSSSAKGAAQAALEVTSHVAAVRPLSRRPAPGARLARWVVAAAAMAAALAFVAYRARPSVATPPARAAAVAHPWIRMTERPPPKSSSPAALAAYRIAMQEYRDASLAHAPLMMKRALDADPELAAAELRLALFYTGNVARLSDGDLGPAAHYRRAVALRDALDDHDRALLFVADAIYANAQRDLTLALARAREARERFPGDEEIELDAAAVKSDRGGPGAYDAMRELVTRAAPLAIAEWYLLNPAVWKGDWDGWRAAGERCIAGTPQAASCLGAVALVYNAAGQCTEWESVRRRRVAVDPESPHAHRMLGLALGANGAPYEVAFGELKYVGDRAAGFARGLVHLHRGDFASAEQELAAAEAAFEEDVDDDRGGDVLVLRALGAEEAGDARGAVKMAQRALGVSSVRSGSAFRENRASSSVQAAAGVLYRAHVLSASQVIDLASPLPGAPVPSDAERQLTLVGLRAEVAGDAPSSRVALEGFRDAQTFAGGSNDVETDAVARYLRGKARWLTGDVEGAIADLEIASHYCLFEENPFVQPRAALLLGSIRESQHDQPAACAAYATVLARWGDAKPRSVTADEARARRKALGCSP
jgi:serine/threonine-protein kinase